MSNSLRSKVIRLAHANPSLRPHLLPLLKTAAEATPYPQLRATLRGLKENDRVEVIFQPRSPTSPPEKRVVTVESVVEVPVYSVYTSSGKVRPGALAGGRISDDGDKVVRFQPTSQQQVREVYSLKKV